MMSLYTMEEICDDCKLANGHCCCNNFCHCNKNHEDDVDHNKGTCPHKKGKNKYG